MSEPIPQPGVNEKLQSIYVTAAFILFVLMIIWGIFSGVALGKDQATYKNVETLNNALHYYFSDQDRYPTATQFNDQQILVPLYMSKMPQPVNVSGICGESSQFEYSQKNSQTFNLNFCLRKGAYGLSKGIHNLTDKEVQ